ncbi:MAG: glycosyltransferase 61 family protein [Mucinivorans sp.]
MINRLKNKYRQLAAACFRNSRLRWFGKVLYVPTPWKTQWLKVTDTKAWIDNNSNNQFVYYSTTRKLFSAKPQSISEKYPLIYVEKHPTYIALLHNVEVIPASNLLIVDRDNAICDIFANDYQNQYYFFDNGFIGYKHPYTVARYHKAKVDTYDTGALVSGNYSFNYYHFIIELLPRIIDIDKYVPKDIPLLIDSDMVKYPQFIELLTYFNINKRPIIKLNKGEKYIIKKLYYPSIRCFIPPNFNNISNIEVEDNLFDPIAIDGLRNILLPIADNEKSPKRIFLYRNSNIRNFNQDKLFVQLQELGFEKVMTDKLSVAQQVNLFSSAQIIVGGTGAAFTNILFCQTGCKVYIINAIKNKTISVFSAIAKYLNVEMINIDNNSAETRNTQQIHADFILNDQTISELVNEIKNDIKIS